MDKAAETDNSDSQLLRYKKVQETLEDAAERAMCLFNMGSDIQHILHVVDGAIAYGDEHKDEMNNNAKRSKSHLHLVRAQCLSLMSAVFESVAEMDRAVSEACNPNRELISIANQHCKKFCTWGRENFYAHDQDIMDYLKEKQRLIQRISIAGDYELAAWILSDQCCQIARMIFSLDRSLINVEKLSEFLVDYAERCFQLRQYGVAEKVISDAFGYGGNSIQLHRTAAKVSLHLLKYSQMSEQKKLSESREAMRRVYDGLELDQNDIELNTIKVELNEILMSCEAASSANQRERDSDDEVDEDWLPSTVHQTKKQQEAATKVAEQHRKSHANTSKKEKTKFVPRKQPNSNESFQSDRRHGARRADNLRRRVESCGENQQLTTCNKENEPEASNNRRYRRNSSPMRYAGNRRLGTSSRSDSIGNLSNANAPRRSDPCKSSTLIFCQLIESYDLHLGCDNCIDQSDAPNNSIENSTTGSIDYFVRVFLDTPHQCRGDRLLLRPRIKQAEGTQHMAANRWILIRQCPPKFRPHGADQEVEICESFKAGEQCREHMHCPFPHGFTEYQIWTQHFRPRSRGGAATVERFVMDLSRTTLRIRFEVEQLFRSAPGEMRFACGACHLEGKGYAVGKKQHKPLCDNEHSWLENRKLVYVLDDRPDVDTIVCDEDLRKHRQSENSTSNAATARDFVMKYFQNLSICNATDDEMVEEFKKLKQRRQQNSSTFTLMQTKQIQDLQIRHRSRDSRSSHKSSGFDDESVLDGSDGDDSHATYHDDDSDDLDWSTFRIREDPDEIYDDSDVDERMSLSNDDEVSDDDAYAEDPYYANMKSKSLLDELLASDPNKYKRCLIHLDGPFNARCRMLDEGFQAEIVVPDSATGHSLPPNEGESYREIREVELRGRANCGPTFDGDEVVVEMKRTKELDGDQIIYRGTVVGILKKNVVRKSHTFLCRVDSYQAHLMRPLDGVAPKIHVIDSVVRRKYPDRRSELVAVYKMVEKSLKLVKIVKLDPKTRRDMLFVVKYRSWLPGSRNMYPLGYVTRVIKSGEGKEDSQRILNLLYQIPTCPSKEAAEAAACIDPDHPDNQSANVGVEDLRKQLVISIDPEGCQDVDDALSIRKLSHGGFLVGVHIADVSRLVHKDDIIDQNASRRVTSYYSSTKKVYHMLPERLSQDLCSLQEAEDRRVISVYFETDKRCDVIGSKSPEVKRSVIKNKKKMTYNEAQELINRARSRRITWNATSHESAVVHLHEIAKRLRIVRMHEGRLFFDEPEDPFATVDQLVHREAHQLIEEFMIKANAEIARFIVSYFPESAPVRRQRAPAEDETEDWLRRQNGVAELSLYFRRFEMFRNRFSSRSDADGDGRFNQLTRIAVLESTIKAMESLCGENSDLASVAAVVGAENRHPLHALALRSWYRIQEPAEYVCYADVKDNDTADHFSLELPLYVQFTSPIRRYMDLIVHRFVTSALNHEPAPYSIEEIRTICCRVNHVNRQAKQYSRASHLMSITEYLQTPFFLPCIVEDIDDEQIKLLPMHLPHAKSNQCTMKYSQLLVSEKPKVSKDKQSVTIDFQRRFYDTRSFHPNARTQHNARQRIRLDTERHTFYIDQPDWHRLLKDIAHFDPAFKQDALQVAHDARQAKSMRTEYLEVTSEMRGDVPIVRHHVKFSATYQRGVVVPVQYGAECRNGFLQAVPRLLYLTPEKDLCLEHRIDPLKCFAELAVEKVSSAYNSIEHYQRVWLPILSMEAATKAVSNGDSLLCDNVPLCLIKRNSKYYGKLYLERDFCKRRSIKLFNNSKEGEDETSDYLCIRYRTGQNVVFKSTSVECTSFVRNVWVCHAVANYVHIDEAEEICLDFEVKNFHNPPPDELFGTGKRSTNNCTVEFITKLLPDRRMEDAVKNIHDSSDLCKSIVLRSEINSQADDIVFPVSDTYDIDVESRIRLKRNNSNQTRAIREALKGSFTLIQGPPGTGKTLTGVKLVYWYVHMNREAERNGQPRAQVLYCGPSNSAVDVAAKMLKTSLGSKCPKLVRVYSEVLEKQVFPIPRDAAQVSGNQKGRRYELIDKDEHHDIALHHLIRKPSNSFHVRILGFDKLFRDNIDTPEEVSDEQIEEYTKLITDAAIEELKNYDVILCTCAASAGPRLVRGANVRQLVIDEGGMCMEPECLVPLRAFKSVKQVVVIGDHRQLQPIVMNSVAKDRGLDISLFERYKDRAIMLTDQYRMHPKICEFPSKQFYEGKLETAPDHECRGIRLLPIWPRRSRGIPLIFCHIEGAEKSLSVSTAEGNEQSKSNDAERDEAVRIYLQLTGSRNIEPDKITILSQYRAQCSSIEENLKGVGFEHPNVSTVIASQGDEWDYVILSLVRSMPQYEIEKKPSVGWTKRNMGFIVDEHQINVALTRARLGLIIIGNKHLLRCDPMWRELLNHYYKLGCVVNTNQFLPSENRLKQIRMLRPELLDMQRSMYNQYGRLPSRYHQQQQQQQQQH